MAAEPGIIEVDAGIPVKAAYLTDLCGRRIGDCAVNGTAVSARIAPYALAQIKVEY